MAIIFISTGILSKKIRPALPVSYEKVKQSLQERNMLLRPE
jgi:hypothetical protein